MRIVREEQGAGLGGQWLGGNGGYNCERKNSELVWADSGWGGTGGLEL